MNLFYSKLFLIPLVFILCSCSTTNNKLKAIKDPLCRWCLKEQRCKVPQCPNKIKDNWWENGEKYYAIGRVKRY